jgi:hypothetical protein
MFFVLDILDYAPCLSPAEEGGLGGAASFRYLTIDELKLRCQRLSRQLLELD